MKRIFLIVLDSLGIGEAPDAAIFGDTGTNTLKRISASKNFHIPNLIKLGLGMIDGVDYLEKCDTPTAAHARMLELSAGKDTTIGHWELAGILSTKRMPTYPNGFPKEIIDKFEAATGRKALCNKPYSGTEVLKDFAKEHERTGNLIVYTSADSVFQIAANEEIVPPELLYEYCRRTRAILTGEHGVGRVIARPYVNTDAGYLRTANRRDFSLKPPKATILDALKEKGLDVIAVGKIEDIFASEGITEAIHTKSNSNGMDVTLEIAKRDWKGLCFVNLVDFDSKYGHRQDVDGYAAALTQFDIRLGELLATLTEDDLLIITADHGCDPGDDDTDHSREYVPLLLYSSDIKAKNLGTLCGFGSVAKLISDVLKVGFTPDACEEIYYKITDGD